MGFGEEKAIETKRKKENWKRKMEMRAERMQRQTRGRRHSVGGKNVAPAKLAVCEKSVVAVALQRREKEEK